MSAKTILFIDSRVAGYETLIAGLDAETRWHVLDADQDGIAQIERLLADEADLDAIQIISHGAPGTLYLGSTVLTGSNLPDHAQRLQSIGDRLTATGDLLLYGCNVAQGIVGLQFTNTLGQLTGADVAASDDISGVGGDWVLEAASGTIEAIGLSSDAYASALNASTTPDISSITFTAATGSDSAKPSLSFSVALSDNFSQTMSLSLLYWAVGHEQTWISLSRTSSSEPFVSQVQLPEYAKSGTYEIRAISVLDNNGTHLSLSRDQLQALGHEVSTTLINPNADESVPNLGGFSAGQPYRAADGSLHVDLSVMASDAGSGLKPSFIVELTSPTGVSLQQWATFDSTGSAKVDFVLPRYAPTGSYVVNTVRLTDQAGNHSMSQPWLAQNPQVVQLVNPEGDMVAPAVSTFTLHAVYDPQTHRPKIVIKGSASDELSGLSGAYVRFSSPEGLTLDAPWMPITPQGKGLFAFEDYKALSTESTPGVYKVKYLFVEDAAGNRTTLASELQNQVALQELVRLYFPVASGQTQVQASDEADFVFGTDLAAETLVGGGGDDTIDGGGGTDTANYSGNYADYKVTQTDTGYTVVDNNTVDGDDGSDALSNIEILVFADRSITTSTLTPQGNNNPTGSVTISGTPKQGQTLTAANTLADADGLGTINYQWKANGSAITGATASTYTLTPADVGKTITVTASYTDGRGTAESQTSAATVAVTDSSNDLALSKNDDYVVLQYASPAIVGAGVGNDIYLISGYMLPAGAKITISDTLGSNSLQLAPSLSLASFKVAVSSLQLTLDTGAVITVLGANGFTYDVGGMTPAGIDNPDISYADFVRDTLGVTMPSGSGIVSGGALLLGAPMAVE